MNIIDDFIKLDMDAPQIAERTEKDLAFNRKVKSCYDMYQWLYKNDILRKEAFLYTENSSIMKSMDAEELKKTLDVNERMVREKIQQIRTKKGLSMAEFGKLLGCERQTVFKYEKGLIKTIPLEVIIKIAQIGNTPPLDLLIPAFRARTPKAHYKVLYRVDKEDPWEHLVVFYNDITLSDGLENKKLEPVEILKRLADCGLFEFEEEEITE